MSSLEELKSKVMNESAGGIVGFPVGKHASNRAVSSASSSIESKISYERWNKIKEFMKKKGLDLSWSKFEREVIIGLMYPKLDAHVSA
jgi:DNA primase catalytic subunit